MINSLLILTSALRKAVILPPLSYGLIDVVDNARKRQKGP
jgi:hypothetical protein